jgi:hypothetical protein
VAFIKTYHEVGLDRSGIQLVASGATLLNDELQTMGNATLGTNRASHYSAPGNRPAHRKFIEEWKKACGRGHGAESRGAAFYAGRPQQQTYLRTPYGNPNVECCSNVLMVRTIPQPVIPIRHGAGHTAPNF